MLRPALVASAAALVAALLAVVLTQLLLAPEESAAVEAVPPDGSSRDADLPVEEACTRLASRLPDTLAGRERRVAVPAGVRVAAWGDPPVVLRCGVQEPPRASPTAEVVEIDGVLFLPGPLPDGRPGATVVDRAVFVEVSVPEDTDAAPVYRAVASVVDETLPVVLEGGGELPG